MLEQILVIDGKVQSRPFLLPCFHCMTELYASSQTKYKWLKIRIHRNILFRQKHFFLLFLFATIIDSDLLRL